MVLPRAALTLLAASLIAAALPLRAQQQTVGLFVDDPRAEDGYTLMSPRESTTTYLIDNSGLPVRTWVTAHQPGSMGYLADDGSLVRSGRLVDVPSNFFNASGRGGLIQRFDWDGSLLWEFTYSSQEHLAHHDIELLPNGNVLMIAWEYRTHNETLQAGRRPELLLLHLRPDHIIEVQPTGSSGGVIVWEWHVWDHLIQDYNPALNNFGVVDEHPELVDINYVVGLGVADWTHFNGIGYNAELDQIVVSARRFSEFWVIDHSTTTAEAASHSGGNSGKGGDLLYRWGNPAAYGRGTTADEMLNGQHDAQWIGPGLPGAGNFLVFDNRKDQPVQASQVKEIAPPVDEHGSYAIDPGQPFGPSEYVWVYPDVPDPNFFSPNVSGAQRQPGGTTLICEGKSGHLFEVTGDEEVVWDYVNPVDDFAILNQGDPTDNNLVFKVRRYPSDFPGFAGRELIPGDPIENFTVPVPVPSPSLVAVGISTEGDLLEIDWDADTCQSFDYNLIYGRIGDLPGYELTGAECGIGVSGSYLWPDPPSDSIYFLIVGTDPTGVYESRWGLASDSTERHSTQASFTCDTTTKVVSSQCP
jgi:hypothetical protein